MDDKHEFVANAWLKEHFGPEVADPIRLHVAAKRYLCTRQSSYEDALSPTSRKSYHDQGGPMSPEEMTSFESEPHYREALELRRWDDLAKETEKETKKETEKETEKKAEKECFERVEDCWWRRIFYPPVGTQIIR